MEIIIDEIYGIVKSLDLMYDRFLGRYGRGPTDEQMEEEAEAIDAEHFPLDVVAEAKTLGLYKRENL